jgi:hypothetical protein
MKPPRFTILTLVITIAMALAAVATVRYMLWCRSMDFLDQAGLYAIRMSITSDEFLRTNETPGRDLTAAEAAKRDALLRLLNYQERMLKKYDRAARSPWLPVGPDEAPPAEP